jgi:hypothetical protein
MLSYMFYKYSFLYNISENIRYFLTGWKRSLIWCPSQLTKSIKANRAAGVEGRKGLALARVKTDMGRVVAQIKKLEAEI